MTTLQFSLFFAALLLAYILVHVRLARFEAHLRELGRLREIEERVGAGPRTLDMLRKEDLGARLERVREELEAATLVLGRIEDGLNRASRAAPTEIPRMTTGERIRAVVESRLLQLGYANLRVLSDLSNASADEEIAVLVECERNNLLSKGTLTVHNGSVRDVRLQNVTQMFP
jgi:hypothetical protein